jgi:hypothetical protein
MAIALAPATPDLVDFTAKTQILYGQITITAGNYATAGITFSFGSLAGTQLTSDAIPLWVEIQSNVKTTGAGGTPNTNQFIYSYAPGTDMTNGKIQVWTGAAAQTALTELSNGSAFPTDTIQYVATFKRL